MFNYFVFSLLDTRIFAISILSTGTMFGFVCVCVFDTCLTNVRDDLHSNGGVATYVGRSQSGHPKCTLRTLAVQGERLPRYLQRRLSRSVEERTVVNQGYCFPILVQNKA